MAPHERSPALSRPTSRARRRAAAGSAAPRRPAVCVLASGGLDSAVLLSEALRRFRTVQPIYVRAGLRWEKAELHALRRFLRTIRSPRLRPLVVLEMPMREVYGDHWSINGRVPGFHGTDASVYIPGRNIMLFAKAAAFCALRRLPILFLGILSANPFPDGSPEFLRAMERALARGPAAPRLNQSTAPPRMAAGREPAARPSRATVPTESEPSWPPTGSREETRRPTG